MHLVNPRRILALKKEKEKDMSSVHLFSVALTFFAIAIAVAAERPSFTVEGRVYCDTCRTGFETPLTTYIAGKHILHFLWNMYFANSGRLAYLFWLKKKHNRNDDMNING